tara:strand:+ start:422 stop:595 length:174 start_codon:yes stop_codon:yes gene_type:complete
VEIWVQDFDGINYYVDADGRVYHPEDVICGDRPPRVVGNVVEANSDHPRIILCEPAA